MKVLFCLLHFGYYGNFESVLLELARRGHHGHVAAEKGDRDWVREAVEGLARECSTITLGTLSASLTALMRGTRVTVDLELQAVVNRARRVQISRGGQATTRQ